MNELLDVLQGMSQNNYLYDDSSIPKDIVENIEKTSKVLNDIIGHPKRSIDKSVKDFKSKVDELKRLSNRYSQ